MNENREFGYLDVLNIIGVALQIQSLDELHRQSSTDDIQNHLQKQDREYLDRILENQTKILAKLDTLCENK